jgi:hypothetical protein
LPGEHIAHFAMPNPFDYWTGMSPLTAAFTAVQSDKAQQGWVRDFFGKNNAVPTAVVSIPQETDANLFEVLKTQFFEQFGGKRGSIFTRSGDLKVEVITQTLQQMEILNSRRFSREEVDTVYGVPAGMLTGAVSGDSRLALEITLARNATQPIVDYFADVYTTKLAPFYEQENLVITAPSLVPQERSLQMQEYMAYKGARSLNENRAELDIEPWEPDEETEAAIKELFDVDNVKLIAEIPERVLDALQTFGAKVKGAPKPEPFGGNPNPFVPQSVQAPATEDQEAEAETAADEDTGVLGGEGQVESEGEQPEGVAAMTGAPSPTAAMTESAQKAAWLGIETEIARWQKVALKEAKEGRAPIERAFESEIIPPDLAESIKGALEFAVTEGDVRTAFTPPFSLRPTAPTHAEMPTR